jgi:hypothetical protein
MKNLNQDPESFSPWLLFGGFFTLVARVEKLKFRNSRVFKQILCDDNFYFYVFGPPGSISQRYGSGSESFDHKAKIVRKTLISTVWWLLYEFLPGFRIRIPMDPH